MQIAKTCCVDIELDAGTIKVVGFAKLVHKAKPRIDKYLQKISNGKIYCLLAHLGYAEKELL